MRDRTGDGTWTRLREALREAARARAEREREREPTAGLLDSQPVRTTERGDRGSAGAHRLGGRTRPLRVASDGRLIAVCVPDADLQDLDGVGVRCPAVCESRASRNGSGLGGQPLWGIVRAWAADVLQGMVDVGRTATDHVGFGVQARRRVVERPCAWVLKCRRVVRDYEELAATTEAWI